MIYCRDCVDILVDYLEGTLPTEQRLALEEHLSYCPPCITFIRTYKATTRIARQTLVESMPDEVASRLRDFLDSRCGSKD